MEKLPFKPLIYPAKIIVAWAEAIGGNAKIRDWLGKNGYPELYTFVFALNLKEEARDWLIKNQYPHLMALINASEGNKQALNWLAKYNFETLWYMAQAVDGDRPAMNWLLKNHKDFAMVAFRMKVIKDEIQTDHDDPHKFSKE